MSFITIHPLDPDDAALMATLRAATSPRKGLARGIEAREPFDAFMESVEPYGNLRTESDTIGGIPGLWVHPAHGRSGEAILHLHAGWFILGSAKAFRNLVAHLAGRAGASAFIPDYRLAPEYPFPAAVEDVEACYRGLDERGIHRVALTGDSAGGNLALGLASRITSGALVSKAKLVGMAALSPVTDLTLSSATYDTRAVAEPYFTRAQVSELVGAYLGGADPNDPRASPLQAQLVGLPPLRIHVGEDEVLLDDSCRFIERAVAAGVDARLDIWQGLAHGFAGSVGKLKAATHALNTLGIFLAEKLQTN